MNIILGFKLMHKTCWKNIFLNKFNSMDMEGTQRKRCYLLAWEQDMHCTEEGNTQQVHHPLM